VFPNITGSQSATGIVQADPTSLLAPGQVLSIDVHGMAMHLSTDRAIGVFPLDLFQGALLALVFRDEQGDHATGSAVLGRVNTNVAHQRRERS
jgi:hypothetical protein